MGKSSPKERPSKEEIAPALTCPPSTCAATRVRGSRFPEPGPRLVARPRGPASTSPLSSRPRPQNGSAPPAPPLGRPRPSGRPGPRRPAASCRWPVQNGGRPASAARPPSALARGAAGRRVAADGSSRAAAARSSEGRAGRARLGRCPVRTLGGGQGRGTAASASTYPTSVRLALCGVRTPKGGAGEAPKDMGGRGAGERAGLLGVWLSLTTRNLQSLRSPSCCHPGGASPRKHAVGGAPSLGNGSSRA